MCGRYVSPEEAAVERAWHVGRRNWKTPFGKPRYNVAPTMRVILLRRDTASPEIDLAHARWGFVPYWWKEATPPRGRFNAKAETAASNGMWREAFSRARCLLPALGWYEWREEERIDKATGELVRVNQPWYIARKDRRPFCFAGLMSQWKDPGDPDATLTCAVLTRPGAGRAGEIHERMPVVLPDEVHPQWLDPAQVDPVRAGALIEEHAQTDFELVRVGRGINRTEEDSEKLIEPLEVG
jgi:putative SOS response-associated peptidase YedK